MNPLTALKNYWLLIALILSALVLGMIGFTQVFPEFGFLTRCYLTMQLFLIDSGALDLSETSGGIEGGGVPWSLETARWLAAGLSFYAVFYAASRMLRRSGDSFRIRGLCGHTVVYGADEVTESFLHEQKAAGRKCVLVSGSDALLKACRAMGHPAFDLEGGLNHKLDSEDLRCAGLSQAYALYALDAEDAVNLRALLLATELAPTIKKVVLRQDEPSNCDLMQRKEIFGLKDQNVLRVISVEKLRARMLMKQNPLEIGSDGQTADAVHLVLPQLGVFEKAVAVQAAFIGHYRNGRQVNLWLPSTDLRDELLTEFPKFERCVNLKCLGEEPVRSIEEIGHHVGEGARVTVLFTHLGPEQAYLKMLRLEERCPNEVGLQVILRTPSDKALPESIREHPNIAVLQDGLGLLGNTVMNEIDRLGRAIHETWYQGNVERIQKAEKKGDSKELYELQEKPAFKRWEDLTEAQRDDNRSAGDHIEVKIRAAGLDPKQSDLEEVWAKLDSDTLDMLSRMEHERWAAPLWLANWEAGPRDDARRIHNNLVPYDELDQGTKDYDTEQVKAAVQYLLGE